MAIYGLSTYGKYIVIREGSDDFPPIRMLFIIITLLFGLLIKYREATAFWSLWSARKRYNIITLLFALYACNGIIHTAHYADNIARPVNYHEPRYLYRAYILSTMEITFYINFPITLIGFRAITGLLSLSKGEVSLVRRYCLLMLLYVIGSLMTLGHYNYEPPSSYTLLTNFTIAGEGIAALLLAIIVIRLLYLNHDRYFKSSSHDLENLLSDYNKDKRSDDEEIETETY